MNLTDHILCDSNGNYHHQGCIAKPFSHHFTRAEWLVVVGGLEDAQHQVWHCQNQTLDARVVAMAAIDWFLKSRNPTPIETLPEGCHVQPAV
jgi:hypothetical protein